MAVWPTKGDKGWGGVLKAYIDNAKGEAVAAAQAAEQAALIGARSRAPLYVDGPARAGLFDPARSVYNWKASNTRKMRLAALGRGGYFSTPGALCTIADSATEGQVGAGTWNQQFAWPQSAFNALVAGSKLGTPGAGGGIYGGINILFGSVGINGFDTRCTRAGTWTNNTLGYISSNVAGSTISFPNAALGVEVMGSAVSVSYVKGGGGTFTVSIDGGAPVAPDMSGAVAFARYTVTGLADGPHTVVITQTNATPVPITGLSVYRTYGLRMSNLARSGSTAQQWAAPIGSGGLWDYRVSGMTPGSQAYGTFISLGANDLTAGRTVQQIKDDIITIRGKVAFSDVVLVTYPEPGTGVAQGQPIKDLTAMHYDLADQFDCPLIDVQHRYGNYAEASANGLYSADLLHPVSTYHADLGRAIGNLLMT